MKKTNIISDRMKEIEDIFAKYSDCDNSSNGEAVITYKKFKEAFKANDLILKSDIKVAYDLTNLANKEVLENYLKIVIGIK